MATHAAVERLGVGAAAGLTGTMLLQQVRSASQRLPIPEPPMREEPGKFMVGRAESALPAGSQEKVPAAMERAAARSLGLGYGITFGVLYALFRPRGGNVVVDGTALGLATWAAGYLGWLPALGLMSPVTEQKPGQVAAPIVQHVLFGIATVTAYDALRKFVH